MGTYVRSPLYSILKSNLHTLILYRWEIFHAFLPSADFFQNQLFRKIISGMSSECQTDWIQIRPNILSDRIWVQIVCKSYHQMTQGDKDLKLQI